MGKRPKGTALATTPPATPALLPNQITRAQANQRLKERAVELFHEARSEQERRRERFEAEYGSIDKIDGSLLEELQRMQLRFAAIARRQQLDRQQYGSVEPKVSKFVAQLGAVVGEISAFIATDAAASLFDKIEERDYVGYGDNIGKKGLDRTILDGLEIIDDVRPVDPREDEDAELEDTICLHEDVETYEDDTDRLVCSDCGTEMQSVAQ